MVTYHAFPVERPLEMGIEVLRHKEWLAAGADDGLCCSSMLPKKKLLHPVLGGEGKATDWADESATLGPGGSLNYRTHGPLQELQHPEEPPRPLPPPGWSLHSTC